MAIIEIDPKTTAELAAMHETMSMIKRLGAEVKGANLNAKARVDGSGLNNAQVLKFLAEGNSRSDKPTKRDFISMGPSEASAIAQDYVDKVAIQMQKQANRNANLIAKGKRTQGQIDASARKQANLAARAGFFAAMDKVKEIISNRITEGVVAGGGQVEDLTEETKKSKQRDHSHVYPVGIATGQVLENLTEGKSNVKITRN